MPRTASRHLVALASLLLAACAGGTGAPASDVATEAEWRALAEARPEPLDGAASVTVGDVEILGPLELAGPGSDAALTMSELVVAGLLRRRDVDFVERRRFSRGVAAERAGTEPPGQPPAGVSRSAELSAQVVWIPTGGGAASIDVRLVRLGSGEVEASGRRTLPAAAGPVGTARAVVDQLLVLLDDLGRRPGWTDPLANAEPSGGVGTEALAHFRRGLAAEERWRWEDARRGYQAALAVEPDFHEARALLARTARLRLGGTLAES